MKQQDILTSKQIKDNMSKTPWSNGDKSINLYGVQCQEINASGNVTGIMTVNGMADSLYPYSGTADITAAITAVNNTYGKGLNPEVYEDVVLLLEGLLTYEDIAFGNKVMIKEQLKKARI